jgi:mono/diheme cytochrome c family protein
MSREWRMITVAACAFAAIVALRGGPQLAAQAKPNPAGWQLGPDADTLKNPHTVDDKLLAAGKAIYKDKCQKCHGPGGLGDGPDADPDHAEDMDLTNPKRAERNSEGVVFYKVWNGRRKPKMPAFKDELSKDQAWAVVAYAQSLRRQ